MTAVATEPIPDTIAKPAAGNRRAQSARRTPLFGVFAKLRSVLFWSHVAMGTLGGLIILIMSVTGVLLGFERQLIARFDGVAVAVAPTPTSARLPLDTLLARNGIELSAVASVALKSTRTEPVTVRFRERGQPARLLNPYTAEVIPAVPRGRMAAAMSWLRGWHRWLGASTEKRPLMRKLTGAVNLAFLLLVLTGLYLWWPKRASKAAFKTAAVFNPRLGGKARDFNWHNSLGFWSAIPLAAVVASGAFISYAWPGQWMDRLWGSEKERVAAIKAMSSPPTTAATSAAVAPQNSRTANAPPTTTVVSAAVALQNSRAANTPNSRADSVAPRQFAGLSEMLLAAQTASPDWRSITITPASATDSLVQVAVAAGNTYRPDLKTQYFFSAETGARVRTTDFSSLSTSRKIRGWTRFGHTGEAFGVPGQILATFVSFVGVILVWTGLALAWRRLVAFLARRRRVAAWR